MDMGSLSLTCPPSLYKNPLPFTTSSCGRFPRFSAWAAVDKVDSLASRPAVLLTPPPKPKPKGAPKPQKQQVMLRFVWMEKNIGLALDHIVPGHGTVPLSPYYFWPRKDAWEEIKTKLEAKKWISKKQTILLLNQATDIINLWQQNATE